LIAASPLIALAMRRQSADGVVSPNRRTLAARSLAAGVLLIAANGSILPLERWCFSRAWGTPFSQTSFAVHGSGWPLYLSLGYVSNPFNIGWRDPIGQVHAHLINPAIRVDSDPAFQRTLLSEYERIVVSEPWLLLRNVRAKAARVDELAGHRSGANTGTAVAQPLALVVMYRAVPIALVATLVLLAWRGTVDAVVVWFSCCALALGASAGPVLVFPEYLGGVQGATVVLLSIVPAAVIGSIAFGAYGGNDSQAARRLIQMYGAAIAVGVAIGAVFVLVQRWRYDARLAETAAAKPLDALRVEEFRYAHLFNDLPVARQGRLVAQLQASADPNISHAIDERKGDFELFAPQVLVRTQSQIHLFVWMGRGFVPPLPRLFQGSTHASLMICGSCAAAASINDVQLPMRWTMINDLEWQGRYRMFSFSNSPTLQKTPFFRVIAERTRALDMQLPMWIVPELISSARLTF
jgi:hypothetical protein